MLPLLSSMCHNRVLKGLVTLSLALFAGCSSAATPTPATPTPRPTTPPRTAPTPLPDIVDAGEITTDASVEAELPGGVFVRHTYTPPTDQSATITASALSDDGAGNPLDLVLRVLDDENEQIAYNDDHGTDNAALAPSDTQIPVIQLSGGTTYSIDVNAFNGFQRGQVQLEIEILD